MALKINTSVTTKDGGSVASGSFIKFSVDFPMEELKYNVSMNLWRTEQAHTDGLQPVRNADIPLFFSKELTEAEYAALTPIVIHNDLKTYLESFVGANNVEVVL
jgi:hypothetical protein